MYETPPISASNSPYLSSTYAVPDVPSMADVQAQHLCDQLSGSVGEGEFQGIMDNLKTLLPQLGEERAAEIFEKLFISSLVAKSKDLEDQLLALVQDYSSKVESEASAIQVLETLIERSLPFSERKGLHEQVGKLVQTYLSKITSEEGKIQVSERLLGEFHSLYTNDFRDQLWALVKNCSSEIKDKVLASKIAKKLFETLPCFHKVRWQEPAWKLVQASLPSEEVDLMLQMSNSESLVVVLQFIRDGNGQKKIIGLLQKALQKEYLRDEEKTRIRYYLEQVLEKLKTEPLKTEVNQIIKDLNSSEQDVENGAVSSDSISSQTMDSLTNAEVEQKVKELCGKLYHASDDEAFFEIIEELKKALYYVNNQKTIASVLEALLHEDIWVISANREYQALVFVGNHLSKITDKDFAMSLLKRLFEKFCFLGASLSYGVEVKRREFAWVSVAEPLLEKLTDEQAALVIKQQSQPLGIISIAEALQYMSETLQNAALQRLGEALHRSSSTHKDRDIILRCLENSVDTLKTEALREEARKLIEAPDRPQIVQVLICLLKMPFVPFLWVARFVQWLCQGLLAACLPLRVRVGLALYFRI